MDIKKAIEYAQVSLKKLQKENIILIIFLKKRCKKKIYHTPKLSELQGKDFANYMDYLIRDL